jgi:hypothetical protein
MPSTQMPSYNRVNGIHCAEHPYLLRKVLRDDFQFDGITISDWSGTASSADSIKASLDLEMPGMFDLCSCRCMQTENASIRPGFDARSSLRARRYDWQADSRRYR